MNNKVEASKGSAASGIKGATTQKHLIIVNTPKIEMLIGGPYEVNGEEHPFGHVAIRVISNKEDITYDFGRYGKTWGVGDSEGEGMLNVWYDFSKYIKGENATGRKTTGYVFSLDPTKISLINEHFNSLFTKGKLVAKRDSMQRYKLSSNYHALNFNCTTVSIDGGKVGIPNFDHGSDGFNIGRSLDTMEKIAAKANGWPKKIFLPADLKAFLETKKDVVKKNEYP